MSDIVCPMYYTPEQILAVQKDPKERRPVILCEYSHAMGNSNGNLHKYWELFNSAEYPSLQGPARPLAAISCPRPPMQPDMPLASGRGAGAQQQSTLYQKPLSNTRPPHHRNSVGTCCVRRVAQ